MKRAMRVLWAGCLVLGQAAVLSADTSRPAMLTSIGGTVEVKEKGAAAWKKAGLMALLNAGDALRTGKGSAATVVFFKDGHREKLRAETMASVQAAGLQVSGGGKRIVVPRGGKEPQVPAKAVIVLQGGTKLQVSGVANAGRAGAVGIRELTDLCLLSPLGAKIRSGKPSFAWTTVAGADAYRLVVKTDSGKTVLERRLTETRLSYPKGTPALEPRILYSWSVEALAGEQSLAKREARLGVLAPSSAARLQQEERPLKQISDADARDTTGPILLSRLYLQYGLSSDAIQQLERATALVPDEPSLHEELGYLYRAVGWEAAAQRQLQRAEELRLPSGNLDGTLP